MALRLAIFILVVSVQAVGEPKCDRSTLIGLTQDLTFASCAAELLPNCQPENSMVMRSHSEAGTIVAGSGVYAMLKGFADFGAKHEVRSALFMELQRAKTGDVLALSLKNGILGFTESEKAAYIEQLQQSMRLARSPALKSVTRNAIGLAILFYFSTTTSIGCSESLVGLYTTMDSSCHQKTEVSKAVENFLNLPTKEQDKLLKDLPKICSFYSELAAQWSKRSEVGSIRDIRCTGSSANGYQAKIDGRDYSVEMQPTPRFSSDGQAPVEFHLSQAEPRVSYTPPGGSRKSLTPQGLSAAPRAEQEFVVRLFEEWSIANVIADKCCENRAVKSCGGLLAKESAEPTKDGPLVDP